MDFIDLFNDIVSNLRNYFRDSVRDIKTAIEIEKLRYQAGLFKKRKENILTNIGRTVFYNYTKDYDLNIQFEELLTLADILECFIYEKEEKIKELINNSKSRKPV